MVPLDSADSAAAAGFLTPSEEAEIVMDEIDPYTDDEEVLQDFSERQPLNTGRAGWIERLREHPSKTPQLSGGDIDAAWQAANVSGEETVGSSVVTPDQDVVDELGEALGIHFYGATRPRHPARRVR